MRGYLALSSELLVVKLGRYFGMMGNEPRSAVCKTYTLPNVFPALDFFLMSFDKL